MLSTSFGFCIISPNYNALSLYSTYASSSSNFGFPLARNHKLDDNVDPSPFFLINSNAVLNYSPVVLIPNPDWYTNKSLIYSSTTYKPEINIDGTKVDLDGVTHQDLIATGIDWNVTPYGMQSSHNITYSIYSDSDLLLATDYVEFDIDLESQPDVDYEGSKIEIGVEDYYHNTYPSDFKYTIYPDGLVMYSIYTSEGIINYEGWIKEEKYQQILDTIYSYNFFNFKEIYFGPNDNVYFDPTYYTMVRTNSYSYYKFSMGLTAPIVTGELWDAIASEVSDLNYILWDNIRLFGRSGFWGLRWRTWFAILGGTTIGLVVIAYFTRRFRR